MARPRKITKKVELQSIEIPQEQVGVNGIGDVIAKVTDFLGIEKCDRCEERRQALNRFFPFKKIEDIEPLSERELEMLSDMEKTRMLKAEYMNEFFDAYNRRFVGNKAHYVAVCQCPGVIKAFKEKLELLKKD
jgi:hypothetical protein